MLNFTGRYRVDSEHFIRAYRSWLFFFFHFMYKKNYIAINIYRITQNSHSPFRRVRSSESLQLRKQSSSKYLYLHFVRHTHTCAYTLNYTLIFFFLARARPSASISLTRRINSMQPNAQRFVFLSTRLHIYICTYI